MFATLTPGATRILELADRLAASHQAEEVSVAHLLWSLWLDESRAAEIMAAHNLSRVELAELLDLDKTDPLIGQPAGAATPPRSEPLQSVFVEARRLALERGPGSEVGSEHLLCGLAAIPSPVQELLQLHGLPAGRLQHEVFDPAEAAPAPLPAELRLAPTAEPDARGTDVLRILDAAANRCREGVRVVEDYVRFVLDDRHLMQLLKDWRHRLADACRLLESHGLIAARDTRQDVGTEVHTRQEAARGSALDVACASLKRMQEAARTLEEYGKLASPEFAAQLGPLRYEAYTLEKAIVGTSSARTRLEHCSLYLLLTQELCPHGAGPVLKEALRAGVRVVQLREKRMSDRELMTWAQVVRNLTADAGALFIMNDRPDLAVLAGADGVHVGQDELSVRDVRRIVGPDCLVGVSTHTLDQARQAVLDGADYIGVGPVFHSQTKSFREFAGLEFVRQVSAEITLPAYAIGGIGPGNIDQVLAMGGRRVAVSGAICSAERPYDVAAGLIGRLSQGHPA